MLYIFTIGTLVVELVKLNMIKKMKFKFKIYTYKNILLPTLEVIRRQCELINFGRISLSKKHGYKYAIYFHGKKSIIDHSYKNELFLNFDIKDFDSIELFIMEGESNKSRVVAYESSSIVELTKNSVLNYKHINRGSDDLIIYFDYSRLVSKVKIHEEFIPKFNFRTEKDVLVLGNQFGYWGTSLLFGDSGEYIYGEIVNFINTLIKRQSYKRIFFVGGSQGATAALAYASAFPECAAVYAASPVEISKKTMLKHFGDKISDEYIFLAKSNIYKTLQEKVVNLYATISDESFEYQNDLAKNIVVPISKYTVCNDPKIGHGDCLRYYIKTIYQNINLSNLV